MQIMVSKNLLVPGTHHTSQLACHRQRHKIATKVWNWWFGGLLEVCWQLIGQWLEWGGINRSGVAGRIMVVLQEASTESPRNISHKSLKLNLIEMKTPKMMIQEKNSYPLSSPKPNSTTHQQKKKHIKVWNEEQIVTSRANYVVQ